MYHLISLLPVLNSLFNPLIYAVKIKYFRVAFKKLLSRKTIAQAQKPRKPNRFRLKQVGVEDTAEQGGTGLDERVIVVQRNNTIDIDNGNNKRSRELGNMTKQLSTLGSTATFS